MDARIGSNVRKYRIARGMSQLDVAEGMSDPDEPFHQQTVLKIEKGVRALKLSEADRLSSVLKVPIAYLLSPDSQATVDASVMRCTGAVFQTRQQLGELAKVLAAQLVNLGDAVAMYREEASSMLIEDAVCWLGTRWGDALNDDLLEAFKGTYLAELPSEFSDVAQIPLQLGAREVTRSGSAVEGLDDGISS